MHSPLLLPLPPCWSSLQAMDALPVIADSDILIKSAHPMSLNLEARVRVWIYCGWVGAEEMYSDAL